VGDVVDRGRPDEAIAAVVPATRGVGDRCRGGGGEFVSYDEGEQRLRQEARLEDAPAVLVGDALLATVADRLERDLAADKDEF